MEKRKHYAEEFKKDAVRLMLARGTRTVGGVVAFGPDGASFPVLDTGVTQIPALVEAWAPTYKIQEADRPYHHHV